MKRLLNLDKLTLICIFRRIIVQNIATTCSAPLSDLWYRDFWGWELDSEGSHQSWRPVTSFTYKIEHCFLGTNGLALRHLFNLMLHLSISISFYRFSFEILKTENARLFTSMLFSIHPIQTEAVVALYGRAELLSVIFMVTGLKCWSKNRLDFAIIAGILALLSKETSIVIFGIYAIYSLLLMHTGQNIYQQFRNSVSVL